MMKLQKEYGNIHSSKNDIIAALNPKLRRLYLDPVLPEDNS